MVDPAIVSSRINQLRDYLSKLHVLARLSPGDFGADFKNVESAKHLLQVAIACCLDLAQHIVADAGFRTPNDYYDAFVILSEHDIVPPGFLPTLRQMVSFRNRVVHLYWEVDDAMLYRILQENLIDFDTYVGYVLDYTEGAPSNSPSG